MSNTLRPAVSLYAWSAGNGGWYGPQSYVQYGNRHFFADSRTQWIRIWINWHFLQPWDGNVFEGDHQEIVDQPNNTSLPAHRRTIPGDDLRILQWPLMTPDLYLRQIDDVIAQAKAAGLAVNLVMYGCPAWANPANRVRGPRPTGGGIGKANHHPPPDDVSETSPWGRYVQFLVNRYSVWSAISRGDNRYVDVLEIMNEPNGQWWPQQDHDGSRMLHRWAARMMQTARTITSRVGNQPLIGGPSLSDTYEHNTIRTSALNFQRTMLDRWGQIGRNDDASVVWTHHNYVDCETPYTGSNSRAKKARDELINHRSTYWTSPWRGWADSGQTYGVLLTEGGVRINHPFNLTLEQHRQKLQNAVRDMYSGAVASPGMSMFTNYGFYSDPTYNTGLCVEFAHNCNCQPPDDNSAKRPAYHMWRCEPMGFRTGC